MNKDMTRDIEQVACPICGPKTPYRVWTEDLDTTRYLECIGCGTVYASPRASYKSRHLWLDDAFGIGDEIFALTQSRYPALRREAELIQCHVKAGRILDFGCSIGAFLELFPSASWQRYGVELSPSAAAYAAKICSCTVHAGTLESVDFPLSSFDVISLIDTLYYLDDPVADLIKLSQLIKPSGILAIEIPGQKYMLWRSRGLVSFILNRQWSRMRSDSAYLFWFSPEGLEKLLKKCGFRAIGWHTVASPRSSNCLVNYLTKLHYHFITPISNLSPKALNFSPKYLCIATPLK